MDWTREAEGLEPILALLVAFAALAERAALLPLSGQLPVLAYVAHAEAAARCFIVGLPTGARAALAPSWAANRATDQAGDRAADRAKRLAADFMALARVLAAVIARARRLGHLFARAARPSPPPRQPAAPRGRDVPARPAPDTS